MPKSKTVTLYGIPNCDTVKKARVWLEGQGVAYRFHDFRVDGLEQKSLGAWVKQLGWEKVLNKGSTTYRALPDSRKAGLDEVKAIALMLESPTMIKRPVLDLGGTYAVGFKPEVYAALFAA